MSSVECPHCGEFNFTVAGWADLDRCASCGRALGAEEPTKLDARVREVLDTRRRRRFRPRPLIR